MSYELKKTFDRKNFHDVTAIKTACRCASELGTIERKERAARERREQSKQALKDKGASVRVLWN